MVTVVIDSRIRWVVYALHSECGIKGKERATGKTAGLKSGFLRSSEWPHFRGFLLGLEVLYGMESYGINGYCHPMVRPRLNT